MVGVELPEQAISAAREALRDPRSETLVRERLAKSEFWAKSRDGRSSEAYFQLIGRLLRLEQEKRVVLVGFDRRVTGREPFGDTAAEHILAQIENVHRHGTAGAAVLDSQVLLFSGQGHTRFDGTPGSLADALAKRGLPVAAVTLGYSGGSAWVCSGGECGPTDFPARPCPKAKSHLDAAEGDGNRLRGTLCIGSASASPPELLEPAPRTHAQKARSQG